MALFKKSPDEAIKALESVIMDLDKRGHSIESFHAQYKSMVDEYERRIALLTRKLEAAQDVSLVEARQKEDAALIAELLSSREKLQQASARDAQFQSQIEVLTQKLQEAARRSAPAPSAALESENAALKAQLLSAQDELGRSRAEIGAQKEAFREKLEKAGTAAAEREREIEALTLRLEEAQRPAPVPPPSAALESENAALKAELLSSQDRLRTALAEAEAQKTILEEKLKKATAELAASTLNLREAPSPVPVPAAAAGPDESAALKAALEQESKLRQKIEKDLREMFEMLMKEREKFAREAEALESQKIFFQEQVKGTMEHTLQIASEIMDHPAPAPEPEKTASAAAVAALADKKEEPPVSHAQYDAFQARLEIEMKELAEKLAQRAAAEQERLNELARERHVD